MAIERVVITGSSGTYGRGVVRALRAKYPCVRILGIDIADASSDPPDEFARCDVLSEEFVERVSAFEPDTIVHLAFVVDPMHDEVRMRRINVGGAQNVIEAARRCRPRRLLYSSSATVYGAWPDNPLPMDEDWQIRPHQEFSYVADKVAVERLFGSFVREAPDIVVSWTRPSIIYAPGLKNYLTNFIVSAKVVALPDGANTPLQFVHVDDLSAATVEILANESRGPFNVSPQDWVTLKDFARLSRRLCIPVPFKVCRTWTLMWWTMRLPWFRFPPGMWFFLRHPWVVSSRRLARELGFRFRFSCNDTLYILLREKRCLRVSTPLADEAEQLVPDAKS